jgi:hypothetical protein
MVTTINRSRGPRIADGLLAEDERTRFDGRARVKDREEWSFHQGRLLHQERGTAMHIQLVTFEIEGISREDFERQPEAEPPAVSETPGLLQTVWLGEDAESLVGYVHVWDSCQAMDRYVHGEAYAGLVRSPYVKNLESREVQPVVPVAGIEAMEAPAAVTGLLFELAA